MEGLTTLLLNTHVCVCMCLLVGGGVYLAALPLTNAGGRGQITLPLPINVCGVVKALPPTPMAGPLLHSISSMMGIITAVTDTNAGGYCCAY